MRGRNPLVRVVLPGVLALSLAAMTATAAQVPPDVEALLVRVGERVAEFYKRASNVICIETSTVQPVDLSYSPYGFVRTVESELRVEADNGQAPGEAAILRKVRKVNGRVPREKDKKDRALETLAEETGGVAFFTGDMISLERAFTKISKELRAQYLVTYKPANDHYDGSFRKIDVRLAEGRKDLKVRTKHGYTAIADSVRP